MYYQALATDYDSTLATDGQADEPTPAALRALRASGRRLILMSGREYADLLRVFPHLHAFDRVVAENGAVFVRGTLGRGGLDAGAIGSVVMGSSNVARVISSILRMPNPESSGGVPIGADQADDYDFACIRSKP